MASSPGSGRQDALPKMVVCGLTENNIPKLLMCDERYMNQDEDRACTAPCNEDAIFGKVYTPKVSHRMDRMQSQLVAGNAGLCNIRAQLQCDLFNKNLTIDRLNQQICALQCEMNMISMQNAMLNEKIQQALCQQQLQQQLQLQQQQQESAKQQSCGRNLTCLEGRLENYNENTKAMEKQLGEMECYVKAMKTELNKVQAERAELEKNRKVIMLYPNPWCAPPSCGLPFCMPPSCGLPSCPPPVCGLPFCPPPSCGQPSDSCKPSSCPKPPSCGSKPPSCGSKSPSCGGGSARQCSFKPNMSFIKNDFAEIYRNLNDLVK